MLPKKQLYEREELIKELQSRFQWIPTGIMEYALADFILEDRKRIVQPIIDFSNQEHDTDTYEIRGAKAMVDTLKLAGLTE